MPRVRRRAHAHYAEVVGRSIEAGETVALLQATTQRHACGTESHVSIACADDSERRSPAVVEPSTPSGASFRLGEELWWVVATFPVGGIAFLPTAPVRGDSRGARITVHDYTWTMRSFALSALLISVFVRRFIR